MTWTHICKEKQSSKQTCLSLHPTAGVRRGVGPFALAAVGWQHEASHLSSVRTSDSHVCVLSPTPLLRSPEASPSSLCNPGQPGRDVSHSQQQTGGFILSLPLHFFRFTGGLHIHALSALIYRLTKPRDCKFLPSAHKFNDDYT